MADETATGGDGTESSHPSEFSKPVGVQDDATWQKFFGDDSPHFDKSGKVKDKADSKKKEEPWREKDEKTGSPTGRERSSKKRSESSETKTQEKPDKTKTKTDDSRESGSRENSSKKEDSSKDPSTDSSRDTDQSKAKESKSRETSDDSPDPKKLLKEAKAETDRRKARSLYKKAMESAFGEVPDEFSDAKWAAARKKREEDEASITKRKQTLDKQFETAAQRLTPAVNVMKRLQAAGFVHIDKASGQVTNSLSAERVDQAIEVMKALRELEEGDFTSLGRIVSKASGKDPEEAMKLFVRGVKVSPEGRAARMAAERAQAEARAAQERIAQLERALQEREQGQNKAQQEAERRARQERTRSEYLGNIRTELEGHPVLKLEKGAERVLRYLIKTAHPTLKSPRYSFEEAADRIVESERRRVAAARGLFDDGDERPAATGRERVRAVPRGESVEGGVDPVTPEAQFERIWARHAGGRR